MHKTNNFAFKNKLHYKLDFIVAIFIILTTSFTLFALTTFGQATVPAKGMNSNFPRRKIPTVFPKLQQPTKPGKIKNVILMIGDGMGKEEVKAASCFAYGKAGQLSFQQMPVQGEAQTYAFKIDKNTGKQIRTITDSAAAATALATGRKVLNGTISQARPGDQKSLTTILEQAQNASWKTGLVTSCFITHATPACFAAHTRNRNSYRKIGRQMLASKIDLMFGGGCFMMRSAQAKRSGYKVVKNRKQMKALKSLDTPVLGRFGYGHLPYEFSGRAANIKGYNWTGPIGKRKPRAAYKQGKGADFDTLPHLSEMTAKALNLLSTDNKKGFFLMVEGGKIDHAGHANHLANNIYETLEFDLAVRKVLEWAKDRDDTLVIVTADHETGGLKVTKNNGIGKFPDATWSTGRHSNADVYVYAWGVGAQLFKGKMNNIEIPQKIRRIILEHGSKKAKKAFSEGGPIAPKRVTAPVTAPAKKVA